MPRSGSHVAFAPDVVFRVIDGEALVLKLQGELVFSLNETGARIAELISDNRSPSAIAEQLSREYALETADAAREVDALIRALESRGLVVVTPQESR